MRHPPALTGQGVVSPPVATGQKAPAETNVTLAVR